MLKGFRYLKGGHIGRSIGREAGTQSVGSIHHGWGCPGLAGSNCPAGSQVRLVGSKRWTGLDGEIQGGRFVSGWLALFRARW